MKLLSIYIRDDQYKFLLKQKKKHGVPLAETIRRALDNSIPGYLKEPKGKKIRKFNG